MNSRFILNFVVGLLANGAVLAADGTNSVAIPLPASDATVFISDQIQLNVAQAVKLIDLSAQEKTAIYACAPRNTELRGAGTVEIDNKTYPIFVVKNVSLEMEDLATCPVVDSRVLRGQIVALSVNEIVSIPPSRYGVTYGTLLIPFKYQIQGDKSFYGGSTLGGYVGYRQDRTFITGMSAQYILFVGGTSVPVVQSVDGRDVEQQLIGVSYGIGLLARVKQNFQIGFVVGADKVSQASNYVNNGKLWVAVSLGFSFSN